MPTVTIVAGCAIRFYFRDHEPAHFHAVARDGTEMLVRISDVTVMAGDLASGDRRAVLGWAEPRRDILALAWLRCREGVSPGRIE